MSILGEAVGGTGKFQAVNVPAGSILPSGVIPKWTSSDVTIATVEEPNSDPTGQTVKLTGIAAGSITLTVTATLPDGTVVQGSAVVPVTAGVVQSFAINQLSQ